MTKDIRFEDSIDISHCDNYYGDYSTCNIHRERLCECI